MRVELRDYQQDAVNRMRNGCILCGGVGSGKSRTSIAYYDKVSKADLYIITTARKRDTFEWEEELQIFSMSTKPEFNMRKNKCVIDSWNNIKKYKDVTGAFFIFDEQRVVGSGEWVKSFLKIAKSNQWILLSATPGDTWSDYIPVFIANGFFKNRTEFNTKHVVFSRFSKYPKIDRYLDTVRLIRLRDRILINMDFNRETESVNDDIFVDYDVDVYKRVFKDRWNTYENKPIETASELCYTLRKIVNSDESRLAKVLEIREKHPKVIIFYNFDYELDLLKGLYFGEGVEVAEWNGHKHQPIPKGPDWVYLVQYTAGAEGWNCITTDTIIFFSQNYSYKVMVQASGRIDRLNTPYHYLYYYHLKSRSSIDISIARALKQKKKFNEVRFVTS